MTFAYSASFDVADLSNGFSTMTLTSAGGTSQVNIPALFDNTNAAVNTPATTTVFNHAQNFGVGQAIGEDRALGFNQSNAYGGFPFSSLLQTAIRANGLGSVTVAFSNTTLKYTIANTATFSIAFANAQTARLFGMATSLSGASSYQSTVVPYFVIIPTLLGVCDPSPNYEPEGIAVQAVSQSGAVFGLARSITPVYRDWIQQYETREKTERIAALAAHPFTYQDLFEKCRTGIPFAVIDGGFGITLNGLPATEVFFLRAEGSMWKYERASPGNGAQCHVPFKCIVAGVLP